MAGQIYRNVIQVPRKVQRLAWLTSPAPAYAEQLPWYHKPPPPPDPPPPVDYRGRQLLAWAFSPMPGYADSLPWRRPAGPAAEPAVPAVPPTRYLVAAWSAAPPPPVVDSLPWRRRTTAYVDLAFLTLPLVVRPSHWSPVIPTPPPGPPSHAGVNKPFIDRVPEATQRLRRHTEKVADILNSLMRQGIIFSTAPGVWQIDTTASPGNGPSGQFDDTFP